MRGGESFNAVDGMGWVDEGLAALEGGRDEDCGGGEEKGKKEFGNCVRGGVFSE